VQTQVSAAIPTPIGKGLCQRAAPGQPAIQCAQFPGAITNAGDLQPAYDNVPFDPSTGNTYYFANTDRKFNNLLPSLNLRYELAKEKIVRFGVSETIGRQNYNLLGAGYSSPVCDAQGCRVNGPNPDLKPLTSKNVDLGYAWYFATRSLVSANVYYSKIEGYAKTGVAGANNIDLYDQASGTIKNYAVNSTGQQGAHVAGIELSYEQPFGHTGFGFTSNISKAKTKVDDGRPLVGASERTANLGLYFENDKLSSRLVWNYRSEYVSTTTAPAPSANSQGLSLINGVLMPTAPTIAAPVATLALNASYNLTPALVLSFDATNLTNAKRAQYRYSEEEQQKLDVSGRQYYVNLKYKF
jgi:iron complex outermembrane receptor protein